VSLDERALHELLVESEDLHSDAMRTTRESLRDLVALGAGALAAGGLGRAVLRFFDTPAFAKESPDIQIMQTAASIENLAVSTYDAALGLPFMAGVPVLVKTFMMKTKDQHAEHGRAFNATATRLGGAAQNGPDPELKKVVDAKLPTLKAPGDVVDLAITLETGAAQTYVANTAALNDVDARKVVASVMGVEAQHISILNAVQALLGTPDLLTLPPPASRLPAPAGSVGFPDSFLKTEQARPGDEGAIK